MLYFLFYCQFILLDKEIQMCYTTKNGEKLNSSSVTKFTQWVVKDCLKEEKERIKQSNLNITKVAEMIVFKSKQWRDWTKSFFTKN
jgi:hypothetical protein